MNKTGMSHVDRWIRQLRGIELRMGDLRSLPINVTEHDATIKAGHMITLAIIALQEIQPDAVVETKAVQP